MKHSEKENHSLVELLTFYSTFGVITCDKGSQVDIVLRLETPVLGDGVPWEDHCLFQHDNDPHKEIVFLVWL